jgi:hypothetical protein
MEAAEGALLDLTPDRKSPQRRRNLRVPIAGCTGDSGDLLFMN